MTTPLGPRSERLVRLGPPLVLAAGLLAVSLLLLYDERRLAFYNDDWGLLTGRLGWTPAYFLPRSTASR